MGAKMCRRNFSLQQSEGSLEQGFSICSVEDTWTKTGTWLLAAAAWVTSVHPRLPHTILCLLGREAWKFCGYLGRDIAFQPGTTTCVPLILSTDNPPITLAFIFKDVKNIENTTEQKKTQKVSS